MDLVDHFMSNFEKTLVNPDMQQKSKFTLLTIFLDLVDRVFSISEFIVVRDLSVFVIIV